MNTDQTIPPPSIHTPPYARLRVMCGGRAYVPTHVAYDRLIFAHPPKLTDTIVEVAVIINGDERRWTAAVQPHSPQDLQIGIRLL